MGTRRRALRVLAAVVIADTAVASCGDDDDGSDTGSGQDLIDPNVIESENGVLEAQLTIEPAQITVGGKTFTSNVYNGDYVAPVLVVRRNDEVRLDLYNRIGRAPTSTSRERSQPTSTTTASTSHRSHRQMTRSCTSTPRRAATPSNTAGGCRPTIRKAPTGSTRMRTATRRNRCCRVSRAWCSSTA